MLIPHNAPPGFDWVTRATGWRQQENTLTLDAVTTDDKTARVDFRAVTPEIWQMRFATPHRFRRRRLLSGRSRSLRFRWSNGLTASTRRRAG